MQIDLPKLDAVSPDCDNLDCGEPVTHFLMLDTSGVAVSGAGLAYRVGVRIHFFCEKHGKEALEKVSGERGNE